MNTIEVAFLTKDALYNAYMPFIKGGGLFIRLKTNLSYESIIDISITLFEEVEVQTFSTKLVWLTPEGATGNKFAGSGLQFLGESSRVCRLKIENYLGDLLKSTRNTYTM